jgi:hypothetical protein
MGNYQDRLVRHKIAMLKSEVANVIDTKWGRRAEIAGADLVTVRQKWETLQPVLDSMQDDL